MSNKFFIVLSSLLIIFLFLFAANSAVSQTLPEPAKRQPVPVDQIPVESHFPLPNQEIEGFRDRLINEYAHKANQITN
ncbi:MAG: hypothetical protein U1C46_10965, partial [Bacteroidales bacterium]|nr:hypothetical protein [Bacteroidales bacterium]